MVTKREMGGLLRPIASSPPRFSAISAAVACRIGPINPTLYLTTVRRRLTAEFQQRRSFFGGRWGVGKDHIQGMAVYWVIFLTDEPAPIIPLNPPRDRAIETRQAQLRPPQTRSQTQIVDTICRFISMNYIHSCVFFGKIGLKFQPHENGLLADDLTSE